MKRKFYNQPTMKVVKVRHRCHILAGSNGQAGVQNYTMHNVEEE